MTPVRIFGAAALVAMMFIDAPARADVYGFVDEGGVLRLSNIPDDSRYQLMLAEPREILAQKSPPRRTGRVAVPASPWFGGTPVSRVSMRRIESLPYHQHVEAAARQFRVDPALVHAVIATESRHSAAAVSPKGAIGLMQVMPDTGRRFGLKEKELYVPEKNIRIGVRYLAELLHLFNGDVKLALAGYNAGEQTVLKYGRDIPPYGETQAYVPKVITIWSELRSPYHAPPERRTARRAEG